MRKLRTLEMHRLTVDEFKEAGKLPLTVVLDDVRSLYNVGSVFRCADAFRVEAVYLCGITACPPNAEIHKTALGSEDSVDWRYFSRTEDAVDELHRQGAFVFSVEQVVGSTKLQNLLLPPPGFSSEGEAHYAVILGNEVKGVKQDVVGTKHSLNVSVTAGIIIWEFARRLVAQLTPAVADGIQKEGQKR